MIQFNKKEYLIAIEKMVDIPDLKRQVEAQTRNEIEARFNRQITFKGRFGQTVRRNKKVVEGNTRDTIDLGHLLESMDFVWEGNDLFVTFYSEYASFVLYGWVTGQGTMIKDRLELIDMSDNNYILRI